MYLTAGHATAQKYSEVIANPRSASRRFRPGPRTPQVLPGLQRGGAEAKQHRRGRIRVSRFQQQSRKYLDPSMALDRTEGVDVVDLDQKLGSEDFPIALSKADP